MHSKTLAACCSIFLLCCTAESGVKNESPFVAESTDNPYPMVAAIPVPAGYHLPGRGGSSFAGWLLALPLKKDKTVYLFNGVQKKNQTAQFAVLNISTGTTDLQQCADAVMRLRAEYLFSQGQFELIEFRDNAGKAYPFTKPYTTAHLHTFLQTVFGMCGTASLSKQLKPVPFADLQAGDVFIRGGFPGHAAIVLAVAVNEAGKKIFLLAQSYMPAQDIHILVNPASPALSPWYAVNDDPEIVTPEYIFTREEVKRW